MNRTISRYDSPLGAVTLAFDGDALCGLWFDGQKYDRDSLLGDEPEAATPAQARVFHWLDRYFHGDAPEVDFPVNPEGTPFQRRVWALLREIPHGETVSYGELARRLEAATGRRTSARAVGAAVARNPMSIVIPCHRVLSSDGRLHGYAGGLERKRALLELEGIDARD